MKSFTKQFVGLSFLIIVLLAASCKKSIFLDDGNEKIPVIINLSGFTSTQSDLPGVSYQPSKFAATQLQGSQAYQEGNLYYWSFNEDKLDPDVKYQNKEAPTISYNANRIPTSFVNSTYSYEGYAAGRALTITGAGEVQIQLPIKEVRSLKNFGFDIGSSNTGPKTFSIAYSLDKGQTFETLIANNQFASFTANAKQTFVYNLTDIPLEAATEIQFKLIFAAGDRGTSSDYNATSGSIRLDNIYLSGSAPVQDAYHAVNKLHYYFFNRSSNKLTSGEIEFVKQGTLSLELEYGQYDFFLVSNNSAEELIIPAEFTKNTFYLSNYFRNAKAEIFGYVGQLTVEKPLTTNIELGRLFSQIKIEFTDPGSLSHIERLVIRQSHQPFQYTPFIMSNASNIQDQSSISFEEDLDVNKQVIYNQFMGKLADAKALSYTVEVYSAAGLIRTFDLGSTLKNNMQLVFRGNLLENTLANGQFEIIRNETWGGQDTQTF